MMIKWFWHRCAIVCTCGLELRIKPLMLISDGRPFDLDYGRQHEEDAEVEYAIRSKR
jgi:hypothetical protein